MALVDMHSSWLVINSIVGCTNGCKYCLLQDNKNNLCSPKILGTPEQAIKELLDYKFYDMNLPLCLFPNTDIFLNKENINYLEKTLNLIEENNIKNTLIIITKCLIPKKILIKLKQLKKSGREVVVYLSYSGLGKELEPNVKYKDIRKNFENLKQYGIPIIHYYRPFLPQNSSKEKIEEILKFVHQYTPVSATMGLMYVPTMMEKNNIWDYLKVANQEEIKKAVSIWPEKAWNYFYNNYNSEQFFYQTNICALNSILKKPSTQYYGTYECQNFNHCSLEQRELCKKCSKKLNENEIKAKLDLLLKKLNIKEKYKCKFDNEHGIEIEGILLDVKTLSYLSFMLGLKVYVVNGRALNDIYNSTLNGAKPYVLKCNEE